MVLYLFIFRILDLLNTILVIVPLFRVMSYYMFFQLYGTLSIASCHNSRLGNFSIFRSICIQKPTDGFK